MPTPTPRRPRTPRASSTRCGSTSWSGAGCSCSAPAPTWSTTSASQGTLRWSLILIFMVLKAGLIVAIFMHMALGAAGAGLRHPAADVRGAGVRRDHGLGIRLHVPHPRGVLQAAAIARRSGPRPPAPRQVAGLRGRSACTSACSSSGYLNRSSRGSSGTIRLPPGRRAHISNAPRNDMVSCASGSADSGASRRPAVVARADHVLDQLLGVGVGGRASRRPCGRGA